MNGSPVVKKIPANKKDRYLLKTGIYVRVSSGKAEQLRSLSAQASALTRYVYFQENWVLKDMYIEVGSAKPGSSRREFSRLIEDCKDHKIENVVVKSLSRFSRDTEEAIESIRTLVKAGVDVYLMDEDKKIDAAYPELKLSIRACINQAENGGWGSDPHPPAVAGAPAIGTVFFISEKCRQFDLE